MRASLAQQVSAGGRANESLNDFLNRARHLEQWNSDIALSAPNSRTATSAASSTRNTFRSSTVAPAAARTQTGPNKITIYGRSREQINRLAKLGLCFRCGRKGHVANEPSAPCKDKPSTPSKDIPSLASLLASEEQLDAFDLAAACAAPEDIDNDSSTDEEDGEEAEPVDLDTLN